MPQPYIQLYLTDDVTPFTLQAIAMDHGQTSATFVLRIWNDLGGVLDSSTAFSAVLHMAAREGIDNFITSGLPVLNEDWGRVRLTGSVTGAAAGGDPEDIETGWLPLGATSLLPLGNIYVDTARIVEFHLDVPVSAAEFIGRLKLFLTYDKTSFPLTRSTGTLIDAGVISDVLGGERRRVIEGGLIHASATPDANVYVDPIRFAYDGAELASFGVTIALNQNDGAAAALIAGESYIALISQPADGSVPIATKGVKATSPVKPAKPAGHLTLGVIPVAFAALSVIQQTDIDQALLVRGESVATYSGSGLALSIGGGRSISCDMENLTETETPVTLSASVTSAIWRTRLGAVVVSATSPEAGAIKLYTATTDATDITALTDERDIVSRPLDRLVIEIKLGDLTAVGTWVDWSTLVGVARAELEQVTVEALDVTAGTGGSWIFDVLTIGEGVPLAGSTPVSVFSSDTFRPTIADGDAVLSDSSRFIDSRTHGEGTRFGVSVLAAPTGTPALTDVRVYLAFRRTR